MTPSWRHSGCSSLLGNRERFTFWTRVSYLWLKKKGGEREKESWALGWNMEVQTLSQYVAPFICMRAKWLKVCVSIFHPMAVASFPLSTPFFFSHRHSRPTGKPLPCPQKWTACIVTSLDSHFAGGLSIKKAKVYYHMKLETLHFFK